MSRDITPFALRMPPELRAQVEDAAKSKGRSLNSEILARLEASFTDAGLPAEETRERFDELTYVIRHFEGSLNRGFNHLATTVYEIAKQLNQAEINHDLSGLTNKPNHPDTKISDLPDPDAEPPVTKRIPRTRKPQNS
ncbi:Arc family DNA-binding protein [Pseudomonas chlororaphis]|uniref:Arc family DNA-binding protein n=1 Tax=Pseudomonas chlororaphis TaxID=587753 RepID=UPI0009BF805C|nr:Arc family DNA-binding protein [Pseudomonas chlororaphis]